MGYHVKPLALLTSHVCWYRLFIWDLKKREVLFWVAYSGFLEKAMAPHSSSLAWKIPWMEEPGRLQSMGSRLSNFTFTFYFPELEKKMAIHSSTLAWKIPWMEEPGRLQSMGSLRVVLDWATSLSRFTFMHWRRKWQPTPLFLLGESQGRGSLVGCHLWGRIESDTTEAT